MSERISEQNVSKVPRFISSEVTGRLYTEEAHQKIKLRAEILKPTDLLDTLDGIIIDVSQYQYADVSKKQLNELRQNISREFNDPTTVDLKSAQKIAVTLKAFQNLIPGYSAEHTPPTPEEKDRADSAQRAMASIKCLRDVLDLKIAELTKQEALSSHQLEAQKARAATGKQDTHKQTEIYKQIGIESPTDREQSRERAIEIVLQDAGARAHTSIERSLSDRGSDGFQDFQTRLQDGRHIDNAGIEASLVSEDDLKRNIRPKDVMQKQHMREIIDIRYDTKPILESVTISGKKGMLGIGKTPNRTEMRQTGRREPIIHSDIVKDGKREPAVKFSYYVPSADDWRDYSGRAGQMLTVEIVLPETDAKELESILDKDPAAMRKIVERLMQEKMLKDPKAWESPQGNGDALRPPYEKWDGEPDGGRIYLQKEGNEPGFHEEQFRRVSK